MKVISVVGYKKSGKTALVSALVRQLSGFGTVGTVKYMGEQRLNPEETDTGRHFDAGADMVIGITGTELVIFARDSGLEDALDMLCDRGLDFAVVEGFKESSLPKMALGDIEGVSNVVIRIPENIDPHEELTASLVGIALAQPDRYTLEALIKKVRK
ncbi:MAG TPA: molybdopterin-guanine dinucleotide biosynthesis protein B, partial [Methanosarcina sp.]|nr:molybdopterin-guanine dinucleotide biosynthesis protein B [Methanosarcina sp.]